jgi:hypothetical protein
MRLYHKRLDSLKDIKKEKQKLRESLKNSPFPSSKAMPKAKAHAAEEDGGGGGILDIVQVVAEFLPMNVVSGMLLRLGLPVLKKAGKSAGKNAFTLGKEVFGGYLKWKVLELGYRWGRRYINTQKEKRAQQARQRH